jgi:hypothetical protein
MILAHYLPRKCKTLCGWCALILRTRQTNTYGQIFQRVFAPRVISAPIYECSRNCADMIHQATLNSYLSTVINITNTIAFSRQWWQLSPVYTTLHGMRGVGFTSRSLSSRAESTCTQWVEGWAPSISGHHDEKNVTCYNQMIVAIVDVLTSFIFIFTNDNR